MGTAGVAATTFGSIHYGEECDSVRGWLDAQRGVPGLMKGGLTPACPQVVARMIVRAAVEGLMVAT